MRGRFCRVADGALTANRFGRANDHSGVAHDRGECRWVSRAKNRFVLKSNAIDVSSVDSKGARCEQRRDEGDDAQYWQSFNATPWLAGQLSDS